MDVIYSQVCELDVHTKNVVVCVLPPDVKKIRMYSTMTDDLLQMIVWHKGQGVTHVAKERRSALIEAAHAAAKTKNTFQSCMYHHHRPTARWGSKLAILAVAHTILVMVYNLLKEIKSTVPPVQRIMRNAGESRSRDRP